TLLVVRRQRFEAPAFFWPLAAYAAATIVSAALSPDPRTSLIDCKQLVLFLLVPLVYRFVNGGRPHTLLTVVATCAAISAAFGIGLAPGKIARRYQSMFNMNDPTVRDRYTMLRIGERMIRSHPLTGVGPNMVQRLYVDYKGSDSLVGPDGVTHINPHLH